MPSRRALAALTVLLLSTAGGASGAVPPLTGAGRAPASGPVPATTSGAPGGTSALLAPGCLVPLAGVRTPAGDGCAAVGLGRESGAAPGGPTTGVPAGARPAPTAEACAPGLPGIDDRCELSVGGYADGAGDIPGNGFGSGEVVAASPDGATGWTAITSHSAAGDGDLLTLATDGTTGATRWSTRVPTVGGHQDLRAVALAADPQGGAVYATASAGEGGCDVAVVVAHDASTGAVRWTSVERAPVGGCVAVQALETDPAGRRVVTVGASLGADGLARSWVRTLDAASGATLWSSLEDGGFEAGQGASAVTHAAEGGTVYVAAGGRRTVGGRDVTAAWTLTAYDAVTGTSRPVGRWDAPEQEASAPANPPAAVRVTPDGSRALVTGGAEGRTLFDITTVAFDTATGAIAWQTAYEGPRGERVKSSFDSVWYHRPLGLSPDGRRAYIAGYSTSMHGANLSMDFVTLAYDVATGERLWVAPRTNGEWISWVPSVSVSPDGRRVVLSGQSRHFLLLTAHYETVAHDAATGAVTWVGRYADGLGYWAGAALSGDGSRLFVTGSRVPRGGDAGVTADYEAVTVAYETD